MTHFIQAVSIAPPRFDREPYNRFSPGHRKGAIVFGGPLQAQHVLAGGTALNTTLHGDRRLDGFASVTSIVGVVEDIVEAGGTSVLTKVFSGGIQDIFLGTAINTTVSSGGHQDVTGGFASITMVSSGGEQEILSGGTARITTIGRGGVQVIEQQRDRQRNNSRQQRRLGGPFARDGYRDDDRRRRHAERPVRRHDKRRDHQQRRHAYCRSGGLADPTTILGHGIEIIHSGGVDFGALIKGGTQFDLGLASSATVFTGSQVVVSGGTATSTTINAGGTPDRRLRGFGDGCDCQVRRQAESSPVGWRCSR